MKITFHIEGQEIKTAIDDVASMAASPEVEHDVQLLKHAVDEIDEINVEPSFFESPSIIKKELKCSILVVAITEVAKKLNTE